MKKILITTIVVVPMLVFNCGRDTGQKVTPPSEVVESDTFEAAAEPEHTVIKIMRQPFAFVIRTGGRIMNDSKDIEIITAKSSGIVKFSSHTFFPGVKTGRKQHLFSISGEQLADDNTELRFMQIKADLEKAAANYERAKSFVADKIITQESFLQSKNEYDKILNEYNNLNSTFGSSGNIISSPADGYVREVFVTEGQLVTTGQPLASIVIEHKLVLKADVSPDHLEKLSSIEKANFTVGYSKKVFKTDEMNGSRISFGRSTGENSFYVPVYFQMNFDRELIEGTFADVYLIGKETKNALVVPNSALMEEYGKLYVFVEHEDGDFVKRYITPGSNNGESTEVVDGLAENEVIVATGTYNIKLSLMSSNPSGNTHNH